MKKLLFTLLFLLTLSVNGFTATIEFDTVAGNSSDATKWIGGVLPTAADDVVLDSTSANITFNSTFVCRSLDALNYSSTATHNAAVNIVIGDSTAGTGNVALRFNSTMAYTLGSGITSKIIFYSTDTADVQTINFSGKNTGNVDFGSTGVAGNYQLTGEWGTSGINSSQVTTLIKGTLNTNGQTIYWGGFSSSGADTRTLSLGASTIYLPGNSSGWIINTNSSSLTFNAGTSVIILSGPTSQFYGGSRTYNEVRFTGSGVPLIRGNYGATFAALTRTGTALKTDGLSLEQNITATETLTLTGNSPTNRLLVTSSTLGAPRTITLGDFATFRTAGTQNVDFRDITITGGAANERDLSAITGNSGDAGGNTGITFTTATTQTVTGNSQSWDTASWTSHVPLPQDSTVISLTAGQTLTVNMPRLGKDILFTTGTNLTLANAVTNYGNLDLTNMGTLAGGFAWTFESQARSGTQYLTSAGKVPPASFTYNFATYGAILQILDATTFGISNTLHTLLYGTLDANDNTITFQKFAMSGGTLLMGNGSWFSANTSTATIWSVTGGTVTPENSTISITDTSATAKTFAGGGKNYNNLTWAGGNSQSDTISGSNNFNTLSPGGLATYKFTDGTYNTCQSFTTSGAGINITGTSTAGYTLVDTAGVNAVSNCTISYCTASGGAIWAADDGTNINGGNNSTNNNSWGFSKLIICE